MPNLFQVLSHDAAAGWQEPGVVGPSWGQPQFPLSPHRQAQRTRSQPHLGTPAPYKVNRYIAPSVRGLHSELTKCFALSFRIRQGVGKPLSGRKETRLKEKPL